METIKLNFDASILGEGESITVEVPYSEGMVATSRFCPMELLSGDVKLLAALNGEPLDDFVKDCRLQLEFAARAECESNKHEALIAGLMASVMEHQVRSGKLTMRDYLLHMDAFSYLVTACGMPEEEAKRIYPRILESMIHAMEHDVK